MPRIYAIFGLFFLFFGCAGNNENEIKGDDFIYGVEIDSMLMELVKKTEPLKNGIFDMVPVVIEGDLHLKEKNTEGWDTIVKLTKIITVGPAKENQENRVE